MEKTIHAHLVVLGIYIGLFIISKSLSKKLKKRKLA